MGNTILPDRSYETTKLLHKSKGVFSKTRRTLTFPPQFRIDQLSDPVELTTTALYQRYYSNDNNNLKLPGTVTPAHNCRNCKSDGSYTYMPDWKPFPFFYKGTVLCKRKRIKKHFPPDRANVICPGTQYISDRRPCGVTRQQLDSVKRFFETVNGTSLSRLLNGSAGYRTYSEDLKKVQGGFTVFDSTMCIKLNTKSTTVIPDICLERRSIGSTEERLKIRYPFLNFETAGKSVL